MLKIEAEWPAPAHVHAFTTTRQGGVSQSPYDTNNVGLHVGDKPEHVLANRQRLPLPQEPAWLEQTHSTRCIVVEKTSNRNADAAITREPNRCLAIMTADCLPIVLSNDTGTEIAAIHAGWRGLADGVIEETLSTLHHPVSSFIAWIGPSACGQCYEVGEEVKDNFTQRYAFAPQSFISDQEKWLANLPKLAQFILQKNGIRQVYQTNHCTIEEKNLFYSYRRDGQTGRIATIIWFTEPY